MIKLNQIDSGQEVTLCSISGGRGIRQKLYSLGLVPGTRFRILSKNGVGPVMISVRGSRLAIGHCMAKKLNVNL